MVTKTFDPTKFTRTLTTKMDIPVGFSDPKIWINSGNFALNRLISGNYHRGIPLSKLTMFAGESGSGKSLLAAYAISQAQKNDNAFVILLDSEGAGDKLWLTNAGVDVENNFMRIPVFTVDDVVSTVTEFIKEFGLSGSDQPVLIVLDSIGMLETNTGQEKFMKGTNAGDQGQLAKQLKKLVKNCVYMCEQKNIGFLFTNHTYESQDMFNPDMKITGGAGIIYASSIVIATRKAKLKDVHEEDEVDTSTGVHGIKINVMVYKSRYNKPFEKTTIEVPWSIGIDPYSGLIEMFEIDGLLKKEGNKLAYTDESGVLHKYFRKRIPAALLDQIMLEHPYDASREALDAAAERELELQQASEETDAEE